MADELTKTIRLVVEDQGAKATIRSLKIDIEKLKNELSKSFDKSKLKEVRTEYKEMLKIKKDEAKLEEKITHERRNRVLKELASPQSYQQLSSISKNYFGTLFGGDFLTGIKDLTKSMIDLKSGVATFSAGTSLTMNRGARNLQLQYGLSGSQAYGFQTAGSMLGIDVTNPEDLAFMNQAQRERLSEYMTKYSAWYDRMQSSGVLNRIQEMQLDFAELKQEFSMNFLEWIGQNKEAILAAAQGALNILTWIGNLLSDIVGSGNSTRPITTVTINSSYTDNSTGGNGQSNQDSYINNLKQIAYSL